MIMNMFNYSVVVPYRDKYDLFVKAVESIPDREDIQIIIVDNAPQCMSQEQVPLKQMAKVVYTTSSPTKGAGHARNVGLTIVEGRFILFLDADDYFTPAAFAAFDKYLKQDYDIVYFKADSINLCDGTQSTRHDVINKYVNFFLRTGNDSLLRYRFVNPVSKMIRTNLVREHDIRFDETPVANDAMFSTKTGHYARTITASDEVVYMITEGGAGTSLTKAHNSKNQFVRFQVAIERYKFVESIGRDDQKPKLVSFIGHAFWDFGPKEGIKWIKYAHSQGVKVLF